MKLLDHPLVVVLGKGGVGRTTITAALGHAAAAQGKRACVAELGDLAALPRRFGLSGRSSAFRHGAEGVDVWSLTVLEALEEFGARKLHLPGFATRVVRNRFVRTFVDAVPGLHDLLLLGKIENMVMEPRQDDPVYDTLIIDAPATGHGLTLLGSPRTMTEMTGGGPFHELAGTIERFLADPDRTALVLTTLPEALPVSETLELADQLAAQGFDLHTVIVNRVEEPALPSSPSRDEVLRLLASAPHGSTLAALAEQAWRRQDEQEASVQALTEGLIARGHGRAKLAPFVADGPIERQVGAALAEEL